MGSFTFKWSKPADEVYVTGTFDGWSKSTQLEKVGDSFEKTVELPDASEKIYYKFVVDNAWKADPDAPFEIDSEGNQNNVLLPEAIHKSPSAAIMSGVTPESTTAQMAGAVPLEEKPDAPTVPATVTEKAEEVKAEAEKAVEDTKPEVSEKVEAAEKKVEEAVETKPTENVGSSDVPTPLIPGNFPATPANELDKPVSVNPLPATDNALNPIKLAPGEPVPESVTAVDINKNVKLDKESYEKADALPGTVSEAAGILPPVSGNMIPESSLPVAGSNDVHISSVAPESTTVALAAGAPIETKKEAEVPEVVKESQERANAEPEASAVPEEVKEKAAVEEELLEKVPEAPTTAEGTAGKGTDKKEGETTAAEAATAVAAAAVAVGGAAFATAVAAKDALVEKATEAATDAPNTVKDMLPESVKAVVDEKQKEKTREEVSPEVPEPVKESLVEASAKPEAAADTEAVVEKKEVEAELLKEVTPAPPVEAKEEETKAVEESKPAEEAKPVEEAKPAEESKPTEEAKPTETEEKPPVEAAPTNGESATEVGTEAGPSTEAASETPSKKKKHRVSGMWSKIKGKLGSKH